MLELLLDSTSMQTIVLTKDGCGTKKNTTSKHRVQQI